MPVWAFGNSLRCPAADSARPWAPCPPGLPSALLPYELPEANLTHTSRDSSVFECPIGPSAVSVFRDEKLFVASRSIWASLACNRLLETTVIADELKLS